MDYESSEGKFSLFECPECTVQFWEPFKNPGSEWYETSDFYHIRFKKKENLETWHKKFFQIYKPESWNLTLLDVGCGEGVFLHECKKRGASVFGIDFDKKCVDFARSEFHLSTVTCESVEELTQRKEESFDVVTFFEVLEHIDDHDSFLRSIRKILKKGGDVFFSTPSRDRMFVNSYKWDFPPNHLTRWNEESVRKIFETYGFSFNGVFYNREFLWIADLFNQYLRTGILSQKKKNFIGHQGKVSQRGLRIISILARIKETVVFPLAWVFFIFGKILKRKNGNMLFWFSKR